MPRYTNQIEALKKDRWNVVQESRALLERAEKEKRSMTPEERTEFDNMNAKVDEHETRINDLEKLNDDEGDPEGDEPSSTDNGPEGDADGDNRSRPKPGERRGRFSPPVRETRDRGDRRPHATAEYRTAYQRFLANGERRDMIMGTQAAGGYLLAPVKVSEDIVKQIDNLVFIRQLARMYKVDNAQALGVRQMTTRVSDANWTTEIGAITPDTQLAFGLRSLTPNQLTKLVTVSIRLIESGQDIDSIVNEELAYKNGISQENGFMVGSGSGQPLGIYTPSASGIPTSQDVVSSVAGGFNADDLIKLKYSIKQPYFGDAKSRFVMGRSIAQAVRTLKDNYGQYLWRAGLASDKPDTILDVPQAISEYSPTVQTSGSYIMCIGNFGYYAIAETRDWFIQRLVELYAATSEVGFLGRTYVDGAPVLGEAFARLKTQ